MCLFSCAAAKCVFTQDQNVVSGLESKHKLIWD
ncbi:unnamed protein product [Coffea canephora]|uniref:Uncharacterized protein n=1 Tax=Coffea canephora TaxID=49390 RepID=A0A068UDZ7_COFCA|nr:unnamed protein product [Coffea canephora]